jgi:hypothetical protein
MARTQMSGSAVNDPSARTGFRAVAIFTVGYGLFAATMLAGMSTLTPSPRTNVADAGGNIDPTVSQISYVLASAE